MKFEINQIIVAYLKAMIISVYAIKLIKLIQNKLIYSSCGVMYFLIVAFGGI